MEDIYQGDKDNPLYQAISLYSVSSFPETLFLVTTRKEWEIPRSLLTFLVNVSLISRNTRGPDQGVCLKHLFMTWALWNNPAVVDALDRIAGWICLFLLLVVVCWWPAVFELPAVHRQCLVLILETHSPLGIKLNPPVDTFLGNFLLFCLSFWEDLLWRLRDAVFPAVLLLVFLKPISLSLLVALAFDALTFCSLHVQILHRLVAKLLRFQISLLYTLGLLMRGKKINVLRSHRVDSLRHQDGPALRILGTMLAFSLVFIFQTTLTYHVLLFVMNVLVFIIQVGLVGLHRMLQLRVNCTRHRDRHRVVIRNNNNNQQWSICVEPYSLKWYELAQREGEWFRTLFYRRWPDNVWRLVSQGHEMPTLPAPCLE